MIITRKSLLTTALGVAVLCAGWIAHVGSTAKPSSPVPRPPVKIGPAAVAAAPDVLTGQARQTFDAMGARDRLAVASFLAATPGPLDNYLLKLEGMADVANARYGNPDRGQWEQALPVARTLAGGMCDCAQRNWLNQFIALGEAGLSGNVEGYHAQGAVLASIGRSNGDPVVGDLTTSGQPPR